MKRFDTYHEQSHKPNDIQQKSEELLDKIADSSISNADLVNAVRNLIKLSPEKFITFLLATTLNPDQIRSICKGLNGTELSAPIQKAILKNLIIDNPEMLREAVYLIRADQKVLRDLVNESPDSYREDLERELKILLPEEDPWNLRNLETIERQEIAKMITAAQKLSFEVERRLRSKKIVAEIQTDQTQADTLTQDLAKELERRKTEHELLSKKITKIRFIDLGLNGASVISLHGRKLPCVYKSKRQETSFRIGIEPGSYYRREWLAGQIDRVLRLNIVTPTVVRDGPDGIGSVQEWCIGQSGCTVNWEQLMNINDLEAMAVLDELTDQSDRHETNFLVTPDGRGVAIDNASAFSSDNGVVKRSDILRQKKGQQVTESLRDRLLDFLSNEELTKGLQKCFQLALGNKDGNARYSEFTNRLTLISGGARLGNSIQE